MSTRSEDYDLIIIGAGAAGLSLLMALHQNKHSGRVLIVEANADFPSSRNWSFWLQPDFPSYLKPLIAHRWPAWAFSYQRDTVWHRSTDHPYCVIPSDLFFQAAKALIDSNDQTRLCFDDAVLQVEKKTGYYEVGTSQGSFRSRKIVDTRYKHRGGANNGLLQCFYGIEVEATGDSFDTTGPSLMAELQCSPLGVEFLYILPFDRRRALIEFTCFSQQAIAESVLKQRLEQFLTANFTGDITACRSESGILPMFTIDQQCDLSSAQQWISAGIAGGAMRASTGYCFQAIQRWAAHQAQQICRHDRLTAMRPIPKIYRWMDKLFLAVIADNPGKADEMIFRLSANTCGGSFARFMCEKAKPMDFLSVIASMPKRRFLKTLLRSLAPKKTPIRSNDKPIG